MDKIEEIRSRARIAVEAYERATGELGQGCDAARAYWFDRWCFDTGNQRDRYMFDCLGAYRQYQEQHKRNMQESLQRIQFLFEAMQNR